MRLNSTKFETVFANDIRLDAKAAWVSYFGKKNSKANKIYHLDSIVDLVKRSQKGEKVFPSDIDIVTGGFPCQDFSIAGKRQGFESKKNHLDAFKQGTIPKKYDPYPPKTHGESLAPIVTCKDALIALEEPNKSSDLSQQKYSKAKYMGSHCQGQTEIKLDSVGPTIRSEHHGNIEYRHFLMTTSLF